MAHTGLPFGQGAGTDVQIALTTYRELFLRAYDGLQDPMVVQLGERDTVTTAIDYKMPVSIGEPAFKELIGDEEYRRLGEVFLEVKTRKYQDGVMELADVIESNRWRGWGRQPQMQADAARIQLPEKLLADALMAGKTTASLDNAPGATTIKFFDTAHPISPFDNSDDYANLYTNKPLTVPNAEYISEQFDLIKSTNGQDYRRLPWTHVLVGPDLKRTALKIFEGKFGGEKYELSSGSGGTETTIERINPMLDYGIRVLWSPYLTEANVWYAISAPDPLGAPWLYLSRLLGRPTPGVTGAPGPVSADALIQWVVDDKSSEGYKHGTGPILKDHVGISAKIEMGVALTIPWRIFRIEPS